VVFKQETARGIRFSNISIMLVFLHRQQKFIEKIRVSVIRENGQIRA